MGDIIDGSQEADVLASGFEVVRDSAEARD